MRSQATGLVFARRVSVSAMFESVVRRAQRETMVTIPIQYIEASEQFRNYLVDLRDTAGLATTNQAFTITEAVLRTFRRQLDVGAVARFAAVLPAVLRALFIADWDPGEPPRTFTSAEEVLTDLLTLRPLHNYASETSVRDVASVLRRHVDTAKFDSVLTRLDASVAEYWRVWASCDAPRIPIGQPAAANERGHS